MKSSRASAFWVHHGGVEIEPSTELLESLHAGAADALSYHHDICQQFIPGAPKICTCGMPALLRELATLMPLPPGAQQPYRPQWAPAAA